VLVGWFVGGVLVLVYSQSLHHADNYIQVDRYVTPRHIVPEWYFLLWYSMLRACTSKVLGVCLLLCGVVQFLLNAGVACYHRYAYSPGDMSETSCCMVVLVCLGLLGGCMPVYPYVELSGMCTVWLFGLHFFF